MTIIVGTPPIDLLAHVSDDFLVHHGIARDICTVISLEKQQELMNACDYTVIPGGSATNQAVGLASLGQDVTLIINYGDDEYGRLSAASLTNLPINLSAPIKGRMTQIVFIFLTQDGGRSFAAYYDQDVIPSLEIPDNCSSRSLVIQGFLFHHRAYRDALFERSKMVHLETENWCSAPMMSVLLMSIARRVKPITMHAPIFS